MKNYLSILLLVGMVMHIPKPSTAQSKDFPEFAKGIFRRNVMGMKDSLPYRLLTPLNYDKKKKYPLVIFFHGAGERGTENIIPLTHFAPLMLKPENRKQYPCFVLVPQCAKEYRWVETDWKLPAHTQPEQASLPMQLTLEIVDQITAKYSIDSRRMYVTGLSMGGFGVWDIIARYPARFAAAVPVCGGGDEKTAERIKNVPIWAFHGALDKLVIPQRSRNMIQALQALGSKPKYTEYPTVQHDSWKPAYAEPDLLKWLFAQQLRK